MAALLTSLGISIHAPREGGDNKLEFGKQGTHRFQSTPPARGATILRRVCYHISIEFQSTPPARGATGYAVDMLQQIDISIHAPREGGDLRSP